MGDRSFRTLVEVIRDVHSYTQKKLIDTKGNPITVEDLQYLIGHDIEYIADLFGIDLSD